MYGLVVGFEPVSNQVWYIEHDTNEPKAAAMAHGTATPGTYFSGRISGAKGASAVSRLESFTAIKYPGFRVLPCSDERLAVSTDTPATDKFTFLARVVNPGAVQTVGTANAIDLRVVEVCICSASEQEIHANLNFWGDRGRIEIGKGSVMLLSGVNVRTYRQTPSFQVQRTTHVVCDVVTEQARALQAWFTNLSKQVYEVALPPGATLLDVDEDDDDDAVEEVAEVVQVQVQVQVQAEVVAEVVADEVVDVTEEVVDMTEEVADDDEVQEVEVEAKAQVVAEDDDEEEEL